MTKIISQIKTLRSRLMKAIFSAENYFLARRSVLPLSAKFGFDRGTPIDRYYIERFMLENREFIKGLCLEVADNNYTVKFGGNKVVKSDIISNDTKNKLATIVSDLQNVKAAIPDNTYDCVIMTQTLGMIPDFYSAISEVHRILKKGGVLLLTTASLSPFFENHYSYWRFTPAGLEVIIKKYFKTYAVKSYGNVLVGQCFWVGMAQEELTKKELDFNDNRYPLIVTAKAVK